MAPLSPTRCCPETPLRCEGERSRAKVPGSALSRQREVQLHRLGRPATDRGGTRRKPRLRLHHRHHRPTGAGPADRRDHPAVHPGGVNGRTRRQVGGPPQVHRTEGKKIIITTVQKFPFILDDIGNDHRDRKFAIIIDEAHSSQGGKAAGAIAQALGEGSADDEEDQDTFEDQINRLIESRKLLSNASYLAFTATPKNKTLELFGTPDPQPDGTVRHLPFHNYTMKQAIDEGFIMDVLTKLHTNQQVLQRHQEHRRRPSVRLKKGAEETPPGMWRTTSTP